MLPLTLSVIDEIEGGTKCRNKLYKYNKYSALIEPCLKQVWY